eukprot:SAG11_NODE_1356_length_5123_cov_2.002787_5_plen_30_part_00
MPVELQQKTGGGGGPACQPAMEMHAAEER